MYNLSYIEQCIIDALRKALPAEHPADVVAAVFAKLRKELT